jgi:TPR repeat protein
MTKNIWIGLVVLLSACSTYDPYQRGIRHFDDNNGEQARQQWEPLAQAGDCDAQYRMGTLYFRGVGVPKDYKIAHYWWLRAANLGQPLAQAMLAHMYAHENTGVKTATSTIRISCEKGCGYGKDMAAAYQWMQLVARYTPHDRARVQAKEKSEQYRQSLTAEQIAKADRYVETWQPSPAQCTPR